MEITDIDIVIRKVLLDLADDEEHRQLEVWMSKSDLNRQIFDQMKNIWGEKESPKKAINEEEIIDEIWNQSQQVEVKLNSTRKKKLGIQITKIAAAIGFIVAFYFLFNVEFTPKQKVELQFQKIEKKNISGQKSRIHLTDGTVVWLNAESTLSYIKPFDKGQREVSLEGEAYFEVAKDKDRPFIVKMGDTEVRVLGTKFNISSFAEDEKEIIALAEGKIQISHGVMSQILTPGWIVEINNSTSHMESYEGNVKDVTAWTKDILLFKNASYQEIFERLERWYGVHIKTEGIPDDKLKFNGSFQDEYLSNVLENLMIEHKMSYELEGENVIIKFN